MIYTDKYPKKIKNLKSEKNTKELKKSQSLKKIGSHKKDQSNSASHNMILGLDGLEILFDRGIIIYIIRSLYIIIFESKHKKETKEQLQKRIEQFEIDSKIPALLSALSIEELLIQLEDAQYRYPIHHHDIELPTFD